MRVIAKKTLREHWEIKGREDSEQPLKSWYAMAEKADWTSPADIKQQFRNASFVGDNRVVFNIHGNKYRLIVVVRYTIRTVFVRFVGTHREYDKINASEV